MGRVNGGQRNLGMNVDKSGHIHTLPNDRYI
jgi:hypothetical protein